MFKRVRWIAVGVIIGIMLSGGIVYAATNTKTIEAWYNNIKIVIDGQEIQPVDANGNTVEPFISNGTTYLPVRAVASALGKEVYWDGPNFTVYLGSMNGQLEYPTLKMEDAVDIGHDWTKAAADELTDNYGNRYSSAMCEGSHEGNFETLLNMKYSRFKGTVYIKEGWSRNYTESFRIEVDGKTIYTSPELTKESSPIYLDLVVTGGNSFKIIPNDRKTTASLWCIGDAGFYQ